MGFITLPMFQKLLLLLGLYLLYKLIFDFIIPVYNTTKQVKQKVGEMQQKMQDQMNTQQQKSANTTFAKESNPTPKSKDYIDFEEIK